MNKTAKEAVELINELKPLVAKSKPEVVICVPYTDLWAAKDAIAGSKIKLGAENVAWADNGAFTGEISAAMLKETGVEYVIIGHSERRQYFGETDQTVNARVKAALAAGLKPIICIGETDEERTGNRTEEVLAAQLAGGLEGLTGETVASLILAYEPVWAIGTGKTATPEMAEETHAFIRKFIADKFGAEAAAGVVIQYGGSMKPENAAALCSQADINGGLIGGAALKADSFANLVKEAIKGKTGC